MNTFYNLIFRGCNFCTFAKFKEASKYKCEYETHTKEGSEQVGLPNNLILCVFIDAV